MSVLLNTVNTTVVDYDTPFIFTYSIGLSDMNTDIDSATITTFIPTEINYLLPIASYPIHQITEEAVTGGTVLTFVFDPVNYEGVANIIRLQCQFNYPSTITSYTNLTKLYINNGTEPTLESSSATVTLTLVPDFRVTKSKLIPIINPSSGNYAIWEILLENHGSRGAPITNFTLLDALPQGFTLAPLWPLVGYDHSTEVYADHSFDGHQASSVATDLTNFSFGMPGSYTGTKYTITVIGMINTSALPGQYGGTINWSASTINNTQVDYSIEISDPTYTFTLTPDVPSFAKTTNLYRAGIILENSGNSSFTNCLFAVDIPANLELTKFNTGTYGIPNVNFVPNIPYSVGFLYQNANLDTQMEYISGCSTNVNRTISISDLTIPDGYILTTIEVPITSFVPGMRSIIVPNIIGTISDTSASTSIQFHAEVDAMEGTTPYTTYSNDATLISDNVTLSLTKSQNLVDSITNSVLLGETIRYTGIINCIKSYIYEPILIEYLPPEVTYVGNESYEYYDAFNDITYTSTNSSIPFPLPVLHPSVRTLADGNKVVLFSYTGENHYDLRQHDTLKIEFDVVITKVDDQHLTIDNTMYLGNNGPNGVIGPNIQNYVDNALDLDLDTYFPENLAQSNTVSAVLLPLSSIKVDSYIQGTESTSFIDSPMPLSTQSGDSITLRMEVCNIGSHELYNVNLLDILPYVDDVSILNPDMIRGSQFSASYISHTITVLPVTNEATPNFTTYYSSGTNPIRVNESLEPIGTDTWSTTIPATIRSLRFTQDSSPLLPGQIIRIDLVVQGPTDIDPNLIAFNSFAVYSQYKEGNTLYTSNIPLEPFAKSWKGLTPGVISGIVFNDLSMTGIYSATQPGLNQCYVSLADANGTFLNDTWTYRNGTIDGYYEFNNLTAGTYYLIFTIKKKSQVFTKQVLDNPLGNQADSHGIIPPLTLDTTSPSQTVYAGMYDAAVNQILTINKQARGMVRNTIYSNLLLDLKLNEVSEFINYTNSHN